MQWQTNGGAGRAGGGPQAPAGPFRVVIKQCDFKYCYRKAWGGQGLQMQALALRALETHGM